MSKQTTYQLYLPAPSMPQSSILLLTVLSRTPTQLCLITPGFVPNHFTIELIMDSSGTFTIRNLNDIFPFGLVIQEIIDYEDTTGVGTLTVFHDLSVPWMAIAGKTFVVVPITLLRNRQELGPLQLDFISQLIEV